MDDHQKSALARQIFTPVLFLCLLGVTAYAPWSDVPDLNKSIFLFLGVFPLLNALFDFVSYSITLGLLRWGLRMRGPAPILIGLLDLAIATILFLALGATLVCVVAGINTLAGTPILDLGSLIAEVRETPKDYIWLYIMLFSTVVPTAIHFILCLFSLQSWYIIIPSLRRFISDKIANSPTSPFAATLIPFIIGFVWAVPFLGAGFLFWSIWISAADGFAWFGAYYLDQMLLLAHRIEAI